MEEFRNPFVPTAGAQPHELAGREAIIAAADVALRRIAAGRAHKSNFFVGLRGVGKTVLLNKIKANAEALNYEIVFLEAPEKKRFEEMIFPSLRRVVLGLSAQAKAKDIVEKSLRALQNFAAAFNISFGEYAVSVDAAPGVADSGDLQNDLQDLFLAIGRLAKDAGRGAAIFIDELQYLSEDELSAVIVALHRVSQDNLPVTFFGAGLPQIAKLAGNAKSYAERLFDYVEINALDATAARQALTGPIEAEGAKIDDALIDAIGKQTQYYPYFLQEWGYHAWNVAPGSPMGIDVMEETTKRATARLDSGFFRVRYDRLTPKEKEYARAMAEIGGRSQKTAEIAALLGVDAQTKGPLRASMIAKGMIYSPSYGDIAFTVPLFDDFLRRRIPTFPPET